MQTATAQLWNQSSHNTIQIARVKKAAQSARPLVKKALQASAIVAVGGAFLLLFAALWMPVAVLADVAVSASLLAKVLLTDVTITREGAKSFAKEALSVALVVSVELVAVLALLTWWATSRGAAL